LVKYADTYDGVAGGIADMGHWFPQLNPAFELTGAITLPGISWAEGYEGRYNALREVFVNVPEIREEFKGTEPLSLYLAAPSIIIFREDKAVLTPADMKGMKIGSTSSEAAMLEALGGVPVIMTPPDLYLSLERGVVDAAICMYGTVNSLRLYEVAKTYTEDIYLPRPLSTAIINQEVWDNLPSDLQEIIGDLGDWASIELSKGYNEEADYMRETILESSPEAINIPSPEQKELWLGALIPVQDAWAEKLEAKGLPARAVLDETLRIIGEGG
jgi:TRAP-type C4-dicarboxylate transport system substrate-binding protein